MSRKNQKYDEEFKKSIVSLHQNGKTQNELSREYGISLSAISNIKKSDCHIHSSLKQRLDAIYILKTQHTINSKIVLDTFYLATLKEVALKALCSIQTGSANILLKNLGKHLIIVTFCSLFQLRLTLLIMPLMSLFSNT